MGVIINDNVLSDDQMELLQYLIITKGDRPNGDRCIFMPIKIGSKNIWGTFCLYNGFHICCCENDEGEIIILTEELKQAIVKELIKNIKEIKITDEGKKEVQYYKNQVVPQTNCDL